MTYRTPERLAPLALFALLAGCGAPPPPEDPPPPGATAHEGAAFEITEVRPGIWHAVGTGAMNVGANAAIVDLGESLLLVDSHITPAAAWVLLQELSPLTPKPVRYVVNTHFHFDHIHGNQVFGDEVEILGHETTYDVVAGGGSNSGTAWDAFVGTLPEQIATLESRLEAAAEADRAEIADALARTRAYQEATASITPVPPTITLERRMTLHRGGHEIQLLFLGLGHTGGDVVTFLPEQKVLITGDLVPFGLPFMGDGYPEWGETIRRFAELDFDLVLPGHGQPFEDKAKLGYLAAYLDDFWAQAEAAHGEGVSAEEAANSIDLTAHGDHFPSVTAPGAPLIAVERAYRLFDARALTPESRSVRLERRSPDRHARPQAAKPHYPNDRTAALTFRWHGERHQRGFRAPARCRPEAGAPPMRVSRSPRDAGHAGFRAAHVVTGTHPHGAYYGALNPASRCDPSQNGLFFECPHRQSFPRSSVTRAPPPEMVSGPRKPSGPFGKGVKRTGAASSATGAGSEPGVTAASQRNPTRSCDWSQRGLFSECPHRQNATRVSFTTSAPGVSSISRLPRA